MSTILAPLAPAPSDRRLFALLLATLVPAMVLAGSAWPRHTGDLVVQLCAVPLILQLAITRSDVDDRSFGRWFERVFPWLVPLLLVLQVVPLPPELWSALPSHALTATVDEIVGAEHVSMPLSLTPSGTLAALAFVLPPLAVHVAMRHLQPSTRLAVVGVVIALSLLNVFVALAQTTFGPRSLWNFYGTATATVSTGLFNSRNHYPALVYMAIPFVLAEARLLLKTESRRNSMAIYIVSAVVVGLLFLGALLSRSRGGMTGAVVTLAVAAIAFARLPRVRGRAPIPKWIAVVPLAILVWVLDREFGQIQARLGQNLVEDYRGTIFANTWSAITTHWPWGTGFGSFTAVYQAFERPEEIIPSFINFAHDDYLQILLEGGVGGLLLMAAFGVWFLVRLVGLVLSALRGEENDVLAVAAAIACSALLLHSVVEYPLRTGSIACVFAVATGLLARPARRSTPISSDERRPRVPADEASAGYATVGVAGDNA